jgi:hypothetical protein
MDTNNTTIVEFGKRWYHMHNEMMQWCEDNIGPGGWGSYPVGNETWMIGCNFGHTKFYFINSVDALAFKFRFLDSCS